MWTTCATDDSLLLSDTLEKFGEKHTTRTDIQARTSENKNVKPAPLGRFDVVWNRSIINYVCCSNVEHNDIKNAKFSSRPLLSIFFLRLLFHCYQFIEQRVTNENIQWLT